MIPGCWDIFALHILVSKYRVGGNSHLRDILCFFFGERCGLLVARAWEKPTCSPMASTHTAHDCPTAHTQPTAARMKPQAQHHE